MAGCSLFDPRDPEDIGGVDQVPWVPPTSMALALENMERTLEAKSITNYDRSLADEFSIVADFGDSLEAPDIAVLFSDWGREQEVATTAEILSNGGDVSLQWTVRDSENINASITRYLDLGYRLTFQSESGDTAFSGNADLYFLEDNGQWFLTRWVDKRDGSGNSTWGMLRRTPSLP
jgi:hypothetical protein